MDFTKQDFINFWGTGYYEEFTYGIGIQEVIERTIVPFGNKTCLEIGCGGGVFTKVLSEHFDKVIGIDVIPMHDGVRYYNVKYIELDNQDYKCTGVENESIDFVYSYGVFCHFSNDAIKEYLQSIYRVLKPGGECMIMISNFEKLKADFPTFANWDEYKFGDMMSIGHFYQDDRTVDIMKYKFKIVSRNLTPDHRDIVVHLKK